MEFEYNEVQAMLKDSIAKYLEKEYEIDKRRKLIHEGGGFSEAHWNNFVEMGWLGASLSEEEGGYGGNAIEAAIILEEFGKVLVVEPFLAVGVQAMQTLLGIGNETSQVLVQEIISGDKRIVLAHSEPQARGAVDYVETTAESIDGGFRLQGTKSLVLGGPFAQQFIVSARTSGQAKDQDGITLFLLDANAAGITKRDFRLADGSRASELTLDNVEVAPEHVLGEVGNGYAALDRGWAHTIVGLCAEAVGAMDRALWITRDYLKTRKQFGQAIGNFQALQHRMADMLIELELSRSVLFRALAHLDADPVARAHAVSIAKIQIGKSAKFVGGNAIQLHGGIGVTEEYSIGQFFKRLTFIDNAFGTVQYHLKRVSETLAD